MNKVHVRDWRIGSGLISQNVTVSLNIEFDSFEAKRLVEGNGELRLKFHNWIIIADIINQSNVNSVINARVFGTKTSDEILKDLAVIGIIPDAER